MSRHLSGVLVKIREHGEGAIYVCNDTLTDFLPWLLLTML